MKNIALTIAAVAALGLTACNKTEEANVAVDNAVVEATDVNAVVDMNAATDMNASDVALDNAGAADANGAAATTNAQ